MDSGECRGSVTREASAEFAADEPPVESVALLAALDRVVNQEIESCDLP